MAVAAIVAVVLLAVVAVFQSALGWVLPWEGRLGVASMRACSPRGFGLPVAWRASWFIRLIILFVLASSGQITADWLPGTGKAAMWVLAGLFTIGAVANFASRSRIERLGVGQ